MKKEFLDSFRFKKSFLYIIFYDLLFFATAILFIKFFGYILGGMASKVDLSLLNRAMLNPSPAQAEIIKQTVAGAKAVVYGLGIAIVLYLAILLFAWSFSRGLIYTTLLKKKFNNKFYWKFSSLNLIFYIPLLIIFLAFVYVIKEVPQAFYVLILILLGIFYFLALSYISFVKQNKIFKSIGTALEFGITKLHKMAIPLALIVAMFAALSFITANIIRVLGFSIRPYISLLVFLIYLAWARIYFVKVVLKTNI